ncbi:MAG: HTTM domain-containing protein [Planctomycetes bacterium]|nr:HTTM domain-containing protein [Planctomycetota bacterium]
METGAPETATGTCAVASARAAPPGLRLRERCLGLLSLDLRSLAVFRIGLGLLLLSDLSVRASDLVAHYTDAGVLPRADVPASFASSVYLLHGSWWFQVGLFGVAALFALALLVGLHTRLATFVSCFLLVSLHARNPVVLDGGDVLLRLLLFWGIFLPLGACFSLDRARSRGPAPGPRVVSVATAALLFQVCFVYWFSVLLKSDPIWRSEGTALYYALNVDQFVTPLGRRLLDYPDLLRLLTFGTLALEAAGPALLFLPVCSGPVRTLVVFIFVLFHVLGLGLVLELGHFPYSCAVTWLALLPTWFWDRLRHRVRPGRPPPPAAESGAAPTAREAKLPVTTPGWMNALAGFFLAYVFLWNVRTLDFDRFQTVFPQRLNWIGEGFGLGQKWDMFAPYPLMEDGWYVVVGTLEDGRQVDLFQGGRPVHWAKPELVSATYKNTRWRKYLTNLWQKDYTAHRLLYARYLCRDWNSRHGGGERVVRVEVYFMLEVTRPNYESPTIRKVLLCEFPCSPSGSGEQP